MEFPTVTKKKKRRTRKCLDEIRKRSRRTMSDGCYGDNFQQHAKNNTETVPIDSHRLVTMNRLTLSVFPKAIRSETITRPLLEEIKHKSSCTHTYQDLNNSIKSSSSPKDLEVECFGHPVTNNSMPMCDLRESLQENGGGFISTPLRDFQNSDMNILETPARLMGKIYSTSSTTSLSLETLEGNHEHELYEELMNNISSHLKKVTSALINEDVIKNTKVKLQKLYNRSWGKENQTSMLKHEKTHESTATLKCLKDSIAQKPLDYIRLKHAQQQGIYDECHSGNSDTFSSQSSTAAAPASAILDSPLTFRRKSTHKVAVYDTPEHNYYPHRLN